MHAPSHVAWRKSSYSGTQGDNCIELHPTPGTVGVRDTKNRAAGALAVSRGTWTAFVSTVKAR